MKTFSLFVLIFFNLGFLSLLQTGQSLTCLSCENVIHPRHCRYVSTCQTGEMCYMKRANTLHVSFELGCTDGKLCTENSTSYHHEQCRHCCNTNLCNVDACGEPGYPLERGPVCFDCGSRLENEQCHSIDFCDKEQVCSIQGNEEFSEIVYTSECKQKHICDPHVNEIIVGKRDIDDYTDDSQTMTFDRRSTTICQQCCTADLCNDQCQNKLGEWLPWSPWTTCSPTCGQTNGTQSRSRACKNTRCMGDNRETLQCLTTTCPGEWLPWSPWTPCSPTCGHTNGKQTRSRDCKNDGCVGDSRETIQCSTYTCPAPVHDCQDILDAGLSRGDGIYNISVMDNGKTLQTQVVCNMTTDGGGWTDFQYRYDGSVSFNGTFSEFEAGFGMYPGEFWLGLKWQHLITQQRQYKLRVDLTAASGHTAFAVYTNFRIGPSPNYTLNVDGYLSNSTLNDELTQSHNHCGFTTIDRDVDTRSFNCADELGGSGWWYCYCGAAFPNGPYLVPGTNSSGSAMSWFRFPIYMYQSLLTSKLSFKPM